MKTIVILFFDQVLKCDVLELHQVNSQDLNSAFERYQNRASKEKAQGFEDKHRFFVVDKFMAFV